MQVNRDQSRQQPVYDVEEIVGAGEAREHVPGVQAGSQAGLPAGPYDSSRHYSWTRDAQQTYLRHPRVR